MEKSLIRASAVSLVVTLCMLSVGPPALADIEWTEKKQLKLGASPVDLVTSPDGKWVIILTPGEILVYSIPEDKVVDRMLVDKAFDKIAYSAADSAVLIASSAGNTIKIIQMDVVHRFSLAGPPFKGPDNASVTIVVFSDYQCPYCARLEPILQQLLDKYPKDVRLVLKQFPLSMHPYARNAAAAALAANNQGKYWEFSHLLFENSSRLSDVTIQGIAKQLGLDAEKFNHDIRSASVQDLINKDMNEADKASVDGTPAIFINGKALRIGGDNELQMAIEHELKRKKVSTTKE